MSAALAKSRLASTLTATEPMLNHTPKHGRGPKSEPTGLNPGEEPMLGSTPRLGGQNGNVLMTSLSTCLEAWRVECSWMAVVAKRVSKFTQMQCV